MAEKIEITDAMRAVIGVESPPWTHEVTTTSVRGFARGVGYTDRVYYDEAAAKAAGTLTGGPATRTFGRAPS